MNELKDMGLEDMHLEYTQKEANLQDSFLEEISTEEQGLMKKFLGFIVESPPLFLE